jgi:hypothetical protein
MSRPTLSTSTVPDQVASDAIPSDPEPSGYGRPARPSPITASAIEPVLRIVDLARILNCSRREVERMLAAGKLPAPNLRLGTGRGGSPLWKSEAIRRWIEGGGR